MMLCGYLPFENENVSKLIHMINWGHYTFEEEHWGNISEEAKDLITNMLCVNPDERYTSEQVLAHGWFKKDFT